MVVHRAEQDHEEEQRDDRVDPARRGEAEEVAAVAVLEDEHQHAVRGDGEQVEDDRLHRDHGRAERDEHQREGEQEDEPDDDGEVPFISSVLSFHWAAAPVTPASAPATAPTVAGTISLRSCASDAFEAESVPLPSIGTAISATVRRR